jgi:hypothetical protein
LRPAAQLGALIRRLDESDRRQIQMLKLMERMVETDRRRDGDMTRLDTTLARIEARLGEARLGSAPQPQFEQLAAFAEPRPRQDDVVPEGQALDFAAITEKAIANSQRSGQRPPDEAAGLAGRLFGRKPD